MGYDDTSERERHDGRRDRYWHGVGPTSVKAQSTAVFCSNFYDRKAGWDHKSNTPPPYLPAHVRSMRLSRASFAMFNLNGLHHATRGMTDEERAEKTRREAVVQTFYEKFRSEHMVPAHAEPEQVLNTIGVDHVFGAAFREDCDACLAAVREWSNLSKKVSEIFDASQARIDLGRPQINETHAWFPMDGLVPAGMLVLLSVSNKSNEDQSFEAEYDVETIG